MTIVYYQVFTIFGALAAEPYVQALSTEMLLGRVALLNLLSVVISLVLFYYLFSRPSHANYLAFFLYFLLSALLSTLLVYLQINPVLEELEYEFVLTDLVIFFLTGNLIFNFLLFLLLSIPMSLGSTNNKYVPIRW